MNYHCLILLLTFFLLSTGQLLASENFLPLPIVNRGDKHLNLTTQNLKIQNDVPGLQTNFIGAIRWERSREFMLLPHVKLRLKVPHEKDLHLYYRYKGVTHLPHEQHDSEFTDIDLSVFDPSRIEVYQDGKKIGQVAVHSISSGSKNKTILLDYSCSGYNVQVAGFDAEFLSVGCELVRENIEGKIVPSLKLNWISSEYKTLDLNPGPYVISFSEGRTSRVQVINDSGQRKEIVFKVNFPDRIHRLKTAVGFGPYVYEAEKGEAKEDQKILPSFMLYGNYYLNNIHSIKFFEALVINKSLFNHAGLYIGSELGKFYDDRLVISSLLGAQTISHRFDEGQNEIFTQVIYPQGLEIAMHHPFGMENYRFIVGGFLSPQSDVTYQNFWARFGSKIFVEFNYINWAYDQRSANMYGLSVGIPFLEFF